MEERSLAYELIQDARKQNKRTFVLLIIVLALWFSTIFGFIWYINQFDYATETTTLDGNGTNNYIGNDGDINNGDKSSKN